MLTNFHTHNVRCKHASGNVSDYVEKAIEEKYDMIGISDHAPMPKYHKDRMDMSELNGYIEEVNEAKQKFHKQIKVYSGLEIEFYEEFNDYYKELLTKLDYLILAPHNYFYKNNYYSAFDIQNDTMLIGYFETIFKGVKSKYFKFVAHPDLFGFTYNFNDVAKEYTKRLAELCIEYDFILEFNANGLRRGIKKVHNEERYLYPYKPFWDIIKEYNVKVLVNSDCHNPKLLNDKYDLLAKSLAKEYGLNVVDTCF
jgi:histidinol-phosphatase (PHP family)